MALSETTTSKLADALMSEVVSYIFEDQRWVDFLHEIVPDAIVDKLGTIDEDLKFDLALCILDRIVINAYQQDT